MSDAPCPCVGGGPACVGRSLSVCRTRLAVCRTRPALCRTEFTVLLRRLDPDLSLFLARWGRVSAKGGDMAHPLAEVINGADGFLLIGDSSADRFPAFSYAAYAKAGRRFYCLDLGGLTESRGPHKGGKVYTALSEVPADHGDLAILWVKPGRSVEAVELAHEAGCRRVWFSFHCAHPDAVARAVELGLEVVEVGRCPVYYLEGAPAACKAHQWVVKLSGTYGRPPQKTLDKEQRIMA